MSELNLPDPPELPTPPTEPKSRDWTEVEKLKGTRFGALIMQYRDLEAEVADLEQRKSALRAEIEPYLLVLPGLTVKVLDRAARYQPPGYTERLDRSKLVRAGVTPEQLQAGITRSPRKGYLWIGPVKEGSKSQESAQPSEPNS